LKHISEKGIRSRPYIKRKDNVLKAAENPKKEDTMQILNNIVELSEKKLLCVQKQVQSEIEIFINDNLNEMYKSMDELKLSFVAEIKDMEEKQYPIVVVEKLKEQMKLENEYLKDQYEELRRKGIDKIKLKYNNKSNLV